MPGRLAAALALLAAVPSPVVPVAAQAVPSDSVFSVARYLDLEAVLDPRISRDGRTVVFTRRFVNKLEDRFDTALWLMNADGTRQRFFAKGSDPVWSPDGTRIAFLAEGEPKGTQVFVKYVDTDGPPTQVTRVEQAPADLRWSPDGRQIGFSMFVPKPAAWSIALPAAPAGAKWTPAPKIIESLHYRADRRGFLERGAVHLFTVPAEGGTPRALTSGDWTVGFRFDGQPGGVDWEWLPDGKAIVTEGYAEGDGDRNYRDSYLYRVDVTTGARTRLTPDAGTWRAPEVSPDGRTIAFIGTANGTYSYRVQDLWTMNADGSGRTNRSAEFDRAPSGLQWSPDGTTIWFTAEDRGSVGVFTWTARDGVRPAIGGAAVHGGLSLSGTGDAVMIRSTATAPGELYRFALRTPTKLVRLTQVNDDLLATLRPSPLEELWFGSSGGARVQGWVVKPPAFDAAKKYPLLLEIHGGPHAMYNVGFNPMFQNFAAQGYVVLYINPRGSTGYGSAFGNAIERAYPSVDYDDLMAGVDEVLKRGYVDEDRMYVAGCSGGGVLSSWVIGHTDRFAGAAVRCPVTNWMSMAGQTDIPFFTYNFFPKPFWEDPAPWLATSPLMHVGKVSTPTLLMTGELDLRTPMPQTEEYFAALQYRGVPTALLRFEGEYHGTGSRPSNWMRTQLYMTSWFERYSKRKGVSLR
jgi:dipeptidyl aminopeptidase/acylaminoacyl peptidase